MNIPESISSRNAFKRKFSLLEMYLAIVNIPGAIPKMISNTRNELVKKDFIERLQLAVTEVNGCTICSYAHAKMALRQGISGEEICSFLHGDDSFIKPAEAKAILFAQHFAESRAKPEKGTFATIVQDYGKKEAGIILSAIQVIYFGNVYGIPISAFLSRLKGKPYKDSSLFYEIGILIAGAFFIPIAILHGILRTILFGN